MLALSYTKNSTQKGEKSTNNNWLRKFENFEQKKCIINDDKKS